MAEKTDTTDLLGRDASHELDDVNEPDDAFLFASEQERIIGFVDVIQLVRSVASQQVCGVGFLCQGGVSLRPKAHCHLSVVSMLSLCCL